MHIAENKKGAGWGEISRAKASGTAGRPTKKIFGFEAYRLKF
jgi:hypothetical protein